MKHMSTPEFANNPNYTSFTTYTAGVMQASVNRYLQKCCDTLLKPYGITKAQWLLIGTIFSYGDAGVRVSKLSIELDTTLAYLTNTINLLESRKILLRTAVGSDNRAKLITVHPLFKDKCQEIELMLRDGLRKLVYKQVSRDEFGIYMKVLNQLATISNSDTFDDYTGPL